MKYKICNKEFKSNKINEQDIGCGCTRNNHSINEEYIFKFLEKIVNCEISKNKRFYYNNKNYYEIDLFLKKYNLAIEFNSLYWHSELIGKDKFYHINKTKYFNSIGIDIIQIFENEWILNRDIVKSIIRNKLGCSKRIYARKTIYKEIPFKLYKDFLEENHIQGSMISKYRYGLFYKDELVSCIGYGMSRFKKGERELHRYCNKINTSIVGGFSKLLKNSKFSGTTFCDLRYFNAHGYKKIGFKEITRTNPNYWYFKGNDLTLHNRIEFQKHKLKDKLKNFDSKLTEWENMQMNGWNRIWDCGNIKLTY